MPTISPITAEARQRLSRILFGFFLFFFLSVAVELLVAVVVAVLAPELAAAPLFSWLASLMPMYLVGLPVLYLTVRDIPTEVPAQRRLRVRDFLTFLLISYATMFCSNLLTKGINALIDLVAGNSSNSGAIDMINSSPAAYTLLFAVFLGPLVEEVIFRHIILRRLLPFGEGFAVSVSALLFGFYHGNIAQLLYAFWVGWILGIVAVRTGKLIHTVLLHCSLNLLGSLPAIILPYLEAHIPAEGADMTAAGLLASLGILGYLGVVLILVAAGVILFLLRRRAFLPRPSGAPIPRGERRYLLLSAGAVAYAVAVLGLFAISFL